MKSKITRKIVKYYRKTKTFFLIKKIPFLSFLFFYLVSKADKLLSDRNLGKEETLINTLWKQNYYQYFFNNPDRKPVLKSNNLIASSSEDHKHPRGTVFDNSKNHRFNNKIYTYFTNKEDLAFLDIGCAGGGLVKSFFEDGYFALGLEGSDTSKKNRAGEWDTIPYHLFTCDITKEFEINLMGKRIFFDLITAWEVLEHIKEPDLPGLINNISSNLKPQGLFIASIDLLPDGNPITGAVYHHTLKSRIWWHSQFLSRGFKVASGLNLCPEEMVRGNGLSLKDWHPDDGTGIHLVLQKIG